MVSVTAGQSPKVAANYFREHLTRDDYYSEGERIRGEWVGHGAERLGLRGEIGQEDFVAVIGNELERFGQQSRPRRSKNCHYDFTFTAPKSVSILSMRDERIRELHLGAVKKAFAHMQSLARVRDRRGDLVRSESTRATDCLAGGLFLHESSRSNDPNLHVHSVLANLTFDLEREGWLALQAAEMYRQRRLLDKIALAELAHGLRGLGYRLERTEHAFEVEGVGADLVGRFSQRRVQVQRLTEELRMDSTRLTLLYVKYKLKSRFDALSVEEKAVVKRAVGSLTDAEMRELATLETRPEKEAKTRSELLALMNRRLSAVESRRIDEVIALAASRQSDASALNPDAAAPAAALRYALDHELERASAVSESRLLETVLHHASGGVRFEEARAALANGPIIRLKAGVDRTYVTTPTVLAEEKAVVDFVRRTRGTCRQLVPAHSVGARLHAFLSSEQAFALDHLCTSRDRVMALRGIAGTGKTTLLRESLSVLHQAGSRVFLFAPSSEASRGVLRKEAAAVPADAPGAESIRDAFRKADTVEKLLIDESLQTAAAGQVLWIDEAGLLSMPAMRRLFDLAGRLGCRVVLAGDVAQHTSVERGDALRVLEKHAGLKPAELSVVRRQRRAEYRQVVEAFAAGDADRGCRRLRRLDAWREIMGENDRYGQLARDYVAGILQGKEMLAVCPTHAEGARVVQAVRAELRAAGMITGKEKSFRRLVNLHLTAAQRASAPGYRKGQIVQFVRGVEGFKAGERVNVLEAADGHTLVVERQDGRRQRLDVSRHARAFSVHEPAKITLAVGDALRVTQNGSAAALTALGDPGEDTAAVRVDNGTLLTVTGFTDAGAIKCAGGLLLSGDFGHLASGYCLTSHASQGKTVDHVLIAESSESAQAAGSRKQGYVSLSRGRESVRIYTDDRRAVEAAWTNDGERVSVLDLLAVRARARHRRTLGRALRWVAARLGRQIRQAMRPKSASSPVVGRVSVHVPTRPLTPLPNQRPHRRNRPTL